MTVAYMKKKKVVTQASGNFTRICKQTLFAHFCTWMGWQAFSMPTALLAACGLGWWLLEVLFTG